jgi:hypothetical protein
MQNAKATTKGRPMDCGRSFGYFLPVALNFSSIRSNIVGGWMDNSRKNILKSKYGNLQSMRVKSAEDLFKMPLLIVAYL